MSDFPAVQPAIPPVPPPAIPPAVSPPTAAGKATAWFCVVASGLYLLNPDFGVFEFLPDNLPIVGNIDEVAATLLLLGCLDYLGIQLPGFITRLFRRK
jgi:hypothetical protein